MRAVCECNPSAPCFESPRFIGSPANLNPWCIVKTFPFIKTALIALVLLSILLPVCAVHASPLFGPTITDVTTRAFSVVWTTDRDYATCGITLYADGNYRTPLNIDPSKITVITSEVHPGRAHHIAMVTVAGLDYDTTYYFHPVMDGSEMAYDGVVKTEMCGGLAVDIFNNDVVHRAVYRSDGTSPAVGVLALAEIMDPGRYAADPADPNAVITDHPISAWVGEGLPGDATVTGYDPDTISYEQYALLEMNNLFGRDRLPLGLHGDDPDTPLTNEGEIIRFTILHGTSDVVGRERDRHWFASYGHVGFPDWLNGERIPAPKVSASFRFKKGVNAFAFPCTIPSGYTTADLVRAVERAEGREGIVTSVCVFTNDGWEMTYRTFFDPLPGYQFINVKPLEYGAGAFIILSQGMTKEVSFYGNPEAEGLDLRSGTRNILSIPQLPLFYETGHLLDDIESAGAEVQAIWFYDGGWRKTYKSIHPLFGAQVNNSVPMFNTTFYLVECTDTSGDLLDFDPFAVRNRNRKGSSPGVFFYER